MTQQMFSYDSQNDSLVFRTKVIDFDATQIMIDACTVAGTKDGIHRKPNEDAFSILLREHIIDAAVFDGCSSQKPVPFLTQETGARFASHFLKETFEKNPAVAPTERIRFLNTTLFAESSSHAGVTVQDVHTLPASTATVVSLDLTAQTMTLNHVGDTFCLIAYTNGTTEFVTEDRNQKYDQEMFDLITKIAQEKKISPREAKQDPRVKEAIAAMFQQTHNKADGTGQGILNGDARMEQYIQTASFPLAQVKALLLGSDGFVPPGWEMQNTQDRETMFQTLEKGGVKEVIRVKQDIEDKDPDWSLLRYKHSDDGTGVYISLKK